MPEPENLRPAERVVAKRVGDSVVLVNLEDNWIHELNETGARIWELITEGLPEGEVAARLADEFDPPPGVDPSSEVARVVKELRDAGLLVS